MGDGMLSLSWNNHKSTFCHILANLRDKERYTDVTLACEGKFYRVHKLVLSTCSEFFEAMFENTPCKHPVVVLNHIKHDEIESLLSYMYAGVVNVAQSDLARLIKAAELLRIKGLAVPDEPPQEAEVRKAQPSPWNSDRTSPVPKRRRRDDSATPIGGSQTSNSPASSPRASPYTESSEYVDKSRTHSDGQSSDRRGDRTEYRSDALGSRIDDNMNRKELRTSTRESPAQNTHPIEETLVKEEVLDSADDRNSDIVDSGMDYGGMGDPLDSNDSSNPMMPNKYEPQVMQSQSQEQVVEALAGPSGMQGWLGDLGGGFASVEGFRGDEGGQDLRQPLPGQPQQPMIVCFPGLYQTPNKKRVKKSGLKDSDAAERRIHCPLCPYSAKRRYNFNLHFRTHTGEKPYSCPLCSYVTASKSDLTKHSRTHSGEKPYACPQCPFTAAVSGNVKKHIAIHHVPMLDTSATISAVTGANIGSVTGANIESGSGVNIGAATGANKGAATGPKKGATSGANNGATTGANNDPASGVTSSLK